MKKPFLGTLDQILKVALNGATKIQQMFTHPDDDWNTTIILAFNDKGKIDISILNVQKIINIPGGKDLLAEVLFPQLFQTKIEIISAAFLVSCWVTDIENPHTTAGRFRVNMIEENGVRNDPQRKKAVHIYAGDGRAFHMMESIINRHDDKPPTLDPWRERPELAQGGSGRFANLLQKGFAIQKEYHNKGK